MFSDYLKGLLEREYVEEKEKYNRLRMGMPYSEVADSLGGDDECSVELGIKNCVWGSEEKNIKVTFIADKANSLSNKMKS